MPEAYRQAVHCLARSLRLRMPDGSECVSNVRLIDFSNRHLAELRENVKFQRREPPAGLAVALQFGLPALECVFCNLAKDMQLLRGLTLLSLTLLDRIDIRPRDAAPLIRNLACFLQRYLGKRTKSHLATPAVNGDAQYPLASAIGSLDQPQTAAVRVFARPSVFR